MADVYVFGDSHWRVFFPFVNHGASTDNVSHSQDGVTTIDTIANELSGSTMWGLLNPNSRNGARNRILSTIDRLGGVENVGLTFGEVDARYHYGRYHEGDRLCQGKVLELLSRYVRFVQEDLLNTGRVKDRVFIYHGFDYPQKENTLLQPGRPIGDDWQKAEAVNNCVSMFLPRVFCGLSRVTTIVPNQPMHKHVASDGVHLEPEPVYNRFVLPELVKYLIPKPFGPGYLPL